MKNGWGEMVAILKEGEYDLAQSFPTRFLYEDFEEEVICGMEEHERAEEEKSKRNKLNQENRKKQKEALLQSAKEKLTKEERKALGI